ncbi:hypothetical protein T09_13553 [Trichinella sp. T9]|nr:hypothetical protein T09_13553 [Trichinella sp. T9]
MLVNAERAVMHIRWIFVLWFSFPRYSEATSKCYNLNGDMNSARQFKRKNKYSNPLQLNAYTRILHTFSSKFQKNILQRVIWKKLKTSIKVWITRNKTLKSDCYILGRNIQLVASPIAVNGIYRRVLVKKLKTNIKVWTTRDKILKSDCRILNRNIKLIASPIAVNGHASSLDSDVSQWLISEPGNKFCAIDKPYQKSQIKEPAMAVCIDDATIFGHFNVIGQNIWKATLTYIKDMLACSRVSD